ncbi:alpha-L-glutamate ligase [Bacillus sp. M6-12]|uniref:YheC/YheD family endospore coat-associated protein n=1 Tax=Bacillus sp. M6-12 TaxID=2054166 RepID=UPI000C7560B4|nr:YheC/YheD family protein [Bacillus sp. M6-12]PLS17463.1 alpha-L-glutamate ligase [Bacillus sp. M6-12]
MTLIGMLHHRADPNKVRRAYAYSVVAGAEGINFFYFTPGMVNITNETIAGKVYENGRWVDKTFPFPDAIYNASYAASEKADVIFNHLFERIPFTSHSIGNKLSVYQRIEQGTEFKDFLIPTFELTNAADLSKIVKNYSKYLIKPVSGHQGSGILFIEKEINSRYRVKEKGKVTILDEQKLLDIVSRKIQKQEYLVQPFITFQTKSGQVYDFRLHVQKNGNGKWVITAVYPRIGASGLLTSNMSSGGYTCFPDVFLKREFGEFWYDMKRTLEGFALSFSTHFDTLYDDVTFDELGIDVGIDKNQKLWLIEVNWRPGPPVIFNCELDVARNTIHYAKYLAEQAKKKK